MSDERICTICSKTLNDGDHNYHGGSNEGDHDFTTDPVETSATKIDKEFEGMATDEVYQREAIELLGEDAANTKSAGGLLGSSVATSSPEAAPLSGEGPCDLCLGSKEIAASSESVMACPKCQKCQYGCTREQYCVSCKAHRPRKLERVSGEGGEHNIEAFVAKITEGLSSVAANLIGARIWTAYGNCDWPFKDEPAVAAQGQKDQTGIDMPQLIAQQILDEAFKPSDRNGDYRLNFTKMKAIIAGHWRGGSPARSHDYHPEYVEAVEKNVRLEEKLAARSVEARELAELVLRLQSQQKKWLTPGGVNAMKPAFKLAEMLQSECDRAALSGSLPSPAPPPCKFQIGQTVKWQGQVGECRGTIKRITLPENSDYVLWLDIGSGEDFPHGVNDVDI